jgi:hypothetical protein
VNLVGLTIDLDLMPPTMHERHQDCKELAGFQRTRFLANLKREGALMFSNLEFFYVACIHLTCCSLIFVLLQTYGRTLLVMLLWISITNVAFMVQALMSTGASVGWFIFLTPNKALFGTRVLLGIGGDNLHQTPNSHSLLKVYLVLEYWASISPLFPKF